MGGRRRSLRGLLLAATLLFAHCWSRTVGQGRTGDEGNYGGPAATNGTLKGTGRGSRLFNILQIVSFPNDPCSGSGTSNGTCYTAEECLSRGGANSGECASGFGVCCVFTVGCGTMSVENCTYFTATGAMAGECTARICPCSNNICQLRLDFNTFAITGPATVTTSAFTQLFGQPSTDGAAVPVGLSTNCLTDTFSVTSPDTSAPPVICGTNTGEHMYVDASPTCNDLTFQIGTESTTANWNIKVTQFDCNFDNLAPDGCTQYFFGSTTGTVQTYNFQSGSSLHLANQDQAQCFRRERGNCRLCLSESSDTVNDFRISGPTAIIGLNNPLQCCQYGNNGADVNGYDCLIIPIARGGNGGNQPSRFCGNNFINTRCTTGMPFMIRFRSDGFEHSDNSGNLESATGNQVGYRLQYFMDNMFCDV